jgi:hypothetical protein
MSGYPASVALELLVRQGQDLDRVVVSNADNASGNFSCKRVTYNGKLQI